MNANRDKILQRYENVLPGVRDIDSWIHRVDEDPQSRGDAMRKTALCYDFSPLETLCPRTDSYRDRILAMYEEISGRTYNTKFEAITDGSRNIENPFPYSTGSNKAVGENLLGVGQILLHMPVPVPAKVLEMGSGWGNTTLTLARTGYNVTPVDIDPGCKDILDLWSRRFKCAERVDFIQDSFDGFETDESFDVVLFFKSFHHSLNHQKLCRKCYAALKPGGFMMLVAEPVHNNYFAPWCIRCDGTSVYMVRKLGWLELGFDSVYFEEMMNAVGFVKYAEIHSTEVPTMNVLLYKKL